MCRKYPVAKQICEGCDYCSLVTETLTGSKINLEYHQCIADRSYECREINDLHEDGMTYRLECQYQVQGPTFTYCTENDRLHVFGVANYLLDSEDAISCHIYKKCDDGDYVLDTVVEREVYIYDSDEPEEWDMQCTEDYEGLLADLLDQWDIDHKEEVVAVALIGKLGMWHGTHIGGKAINSWDVNKLLCLGENDMDRITIHHTAATPELVWRGYHHDGTHVMRIYPVTESTIKKIGGDELIEQYEMEGLDMLNLPDMLESIANVVSPLGVGADRLGAK